MSGLRQRQSRHSRVSWAALVLLAATGTLADAADLAAPPNAAGSDLSIVMADDFEGAKELSARWWMGQALAGRYWIDERQSRTGRHALALGIRESDRGCGSRCQRNEIRTDPNLRLKFGQDTWISFSFRIQEDAFRHANRRWISGQWKQETGGSPFLAQRFDHGVFHIAVHDEHCRILVAKGDGDLVPVGTTVDTKKVEGHTFATGKQPYGCNTDVRVDSSADPILPDPFGNWVDMTYHVRGGRQGRGLIEIWANGRFIARVTGSIGYSQVAGPTQYFKFGIYRDAVPGSTTVHLDDFKLTSGRE